MASPWEAGCGNRRTSSPKIVPANTAIEDDRYPLSHHIQPRREETPTYCPAPRRPSPGRRYAQENPTFKAVPTGAPAEYLDISREPTPTSHQAFTPSSEPTSFRPVSLVPSHQAACPEYEKPEPTASLTDVPPEYGHSLTQQDTSYSSTEYKLAPISTTSGWISKAALDDRPNFTLNQKPVWRQWLIELLFCVISLFSFFIIIAVLGVYDGRPLPKLPLNITLNTFLAFFTTFTKAAFMIPINEALSQWKWNAITPGNPHRRYTGTLYNFEVLDSASRGTWGAWRLLRNFKWRHFVSVAALFSVVSVFTSPIMQGMIAYMERPAPIQVDAFVPLTARYNETSIDALANVMRATFAGMSNSVATPVLAIPATCGSANCTFTPYSSLAVCMKMADVSRFLTVAEIKNSTSANWTNGEKSMIAVYEGNGTTAWNASLPNGISFVTPLSYSMLLMGSDTSLSFNENRDDNFTALAHLYVIYPNAGNVSYLGYNRSADSKPWEFRAVEVLYHACVNTYETAFIAGNSTTKVTASSNTILPVADNVPLYNAQCNFTETDLSATACDFADRRGGDTYLVDPSAPTSLEKKYGFGRQSSNTVTYNIYFDMASSFVADGVRGNIAYFTKQNYFALKLALYGPQYELRDTKAQFERLGGYFNGTATALSNILRTGPVASEALEGVALANETFVSIRWGWATFLAAQIMLAYLFLAVTIYRTAKLGTPVLKSSELATLLASTEELRVAIGSIEGIQDAGERAKKVAVKLERGRLVLA